MATTTMVVESETTKTGADLTPAQQARANRLANKRGAKAAEELASIPGAKAVVNNGTVATKTRTVNAVPKSAQTGTKGKGGKATAPAPKLTAAQQKKADAEAAKQAAIKEQEKVAKQAAAAAAKEKREEAAKARADAKVKRDKEREEKKTAREEAQKAREEARKPQIMGTEYPSETISVKIDDLRNLPDLVGAQPSPRFIKSVKEHGVIEPIILVRQNDTDTEYRLAGGRRRIMAAIHAQIAEIPAIVYTVGNKIETFSEGATIHLNTLRSENVAADLQAIARLQGKYTLEQIARETGMPLGTVKKRVRLLGLPERFLQLLYSGKVPHTVLTEASSLNAEQLDALYKVFETTGRITKKDVDAMKRAGRAEAADGLDFDAMMDGTPDAAEVTEKRKDTGPIRNTGDLAGDLVAFLSTGAAASGIAFLMGGDGVMRLTRGDQVVELQGRQGVAPASAEDDDEDEADTTGGYDDASAGARALEADEEDAANAPEVDPADQDFADDFDPA